MKIKHFAGYGTVEAKRIPPDKTKGCPTLHVLVTGNHEWGIRRDDDYDLFNWLVKRFVKTIPDYQTWRLMYPVIEIREGTNADGVDVCDYRFWWH